jgi:putative PIN family toxin of toxin-antitoxin system
MPFGVDYERVFGKMETKFKIAPQIRKEMEEVIQERVMIYKPHTSLPTLCRDKDDNHVLQLAESIRADYIITGDQDLLILNEYHQTQIVTPGMFKDRMMKSS